jgi:hypothetical protein
MQVAGPHCTLLLWVIPRSSNSSCTTCSYKPLTTVGTKECSSSPPWVSAHLQIPSFLQPLHMLDLATTFPSSSSHLSGWVLDPETSWQLLILSLAWSVSWTTWNS